MPRVERVSRIREHLSLEEVRRRHRAEKRAVLRRRWQIVLSVQADPRSAALVARQLDCSASTVSHVVSAYNRLGPAGLEPAARRADSRQGGALLGRAEQAELLEGLRAAAGAGRLVTARPVREAMEARLGRAVSASAVHRLLARHGWRKLVPRPRHPQADPVAQAAHKKSCPSR